MSDDKPKAPPQPPPPPPPPEPPGTDFGEDIGKGTTVIDTTLPSISDTLKPTRPQPGGGSGEE